MAIPPFNSVRSPLDPRSPLTFARPETPPTSRKQEAGTSLLETETSSLAFLAFEEFEGRETSFTFSKGSKTRRVTPIDLFTPEQSPERKRESRNSLPLTSPDTVTPFISFELPKVRKGLEEIELAPIHRTVGENGDICAYLTSIQKTTKKEDDERLRAIDRSFRAFLLNLTERAIMPRDEKTIAESLTLAVQAMSRDNQLRSMEQAEKGVLDNVNSFDPYRDLPRYSTPDRTPTPSPLPSPTSSERELIREAGGYRILSRSAALDSPPPATLNPPTPSIGSDDDLFGRSIC